MRWFCSRFVSRASADALKSAKGRKVIMVLVSAAVLSPHESYSSKQKPAAVFSLTCDALHDAWGANRLFVMHRAGTAQGTRLAR